MILNWIDINDYTCAECKAYIDTNSYYTISSERSGPHTTYSCYYKQVDYIYSGKINEDYIWRIDDAKAMCESHFQWDKKYYRDMKIDIILGIS
jgi:hypothetical protein